MIISARRTGLSLSLYTLFSLAACGGGSGGGGGGTAPPVVPPTQPTPTSAPAVGPAVSIPLHGMIPTVIAYQSGTSGKWTTVSPALTGNGGVVTFNLAAGASAYSVAAVCPQNAAGLRHGPGEIIIGATTADSPSILCQGPVPETVNATVFMDASAFPATDRFFASQLVNWTSSGGPGFGGPAGGDEIGSPLWQAGPSDFILGVNDAAGVLQAARIAHGVTLQSNQTMTFTPLTSADAVTLGTFTPPVNSSSTFYYWVTSSGVMRSMANANTGFPLLPASAASGDYYHVTSAASVGGQFTFVGAAGTTPSAITLPAFATTPYLLPVPAAADLPTISVAYSGFTLPNRFYNIALSYTTSVPIAAGAPLVSITASSSYIGASQSITVPDLSSVPGTIPAAHNQTLNIIADSLAASGAFPWDDLTSSNSFGYAPLPPGGQFQLVQSQGNLTITAP